MDRLSTILSTRDFTEPPEIKLIKDYVKSEFKSEVNVTIREKVIVIHAPDAALATTLRLHGPRIKKLLNTNKRLVFQSL
jgi:hypothetical protein